MRLLSSRQSLNDAAAIWLLLVLCLVPIPLASNLPVIWSINAAVIGLSCIVYFALLLRTRQSASASLVGLRFVALLWLLVCGVLLIQLLPIPTPVPTRLAPAATETLISPQISLAPGDTYFSLLQMVSYGLFFLLMLQVATRQSRGLMLLRAIVFITAGFAVWGLVSLTQLGDSILGMPKWVYEGAATGTFVNRNSFATFLALGLVCGAGALSASEPGFEGLGLVRSAMRRLPLLAAMALCAAALLATQSRMGLAAGLAGIVVVAILVVIKRGRINAGIGVLLAAGVIAATALLAIYGSAVLDRLGSTESALDVRTALYAQVWEMIRARPWLGYGGGAFELAFPLFHTLPVSVDVTWNKSHSTYLALWFELGLIAGTLPMLAIVTLFIKLALNYRKMLSMSPGVVAAIGAIVVCALHSSVDFSLEIQAVAFLFTAILAIGIAPVLRPADPRRSAEIV